MKVGQTVTLVSDHQERAAVIIEITGTGDSGYKTLALAWRDDDGSHSASDVVHERDAGTRARFWREGNPRQNQAGTPVVTPTEEDPTPKKASTTKK